MSEPRTCKFCGSVIDDTTRGPYRHYCSKAHYDAHKHRIYYKRRPRPEPPIKHGTAAGYARCKCAECRAWMAAYQRDRRARPTAAHDERHPRSVTT